MIDVMMLIESGQPDANGHTFPMTETAGSAIIRNTVAGNVKTASGTSLPAPMTLVAAGGTFNVETATCGVTCITCSGYSNPAVTPNPDLCPVGDSMQLTFEATDSNGDVVYPSATWSSTDTLVMTVNAAGDLVVDAHMANEGDGWSGSGANPWHLDATTDSVLFLTNESNQPARVGLSITAENVHYYLTSLELAPYETRAISIRQLRDAQVADFKGNKIPPNATDGSVNWVRIDDVPMSGRLMVIRRGQGTVSSYDCCTCVCPLSFTTVTVTPSPSFDTLAGGTTACTCTADYYSCNSTPYYYDETVGASWSSSDTSVATMDGSVNGQVDAVAAGSATIQAAYSGDQWYYYSPQARCVSNLIHATGSNTANVCGLSISSPAANAVYSLGGANYNQATVPLEADSSCSGAASWTLNFTYTPKTGGPFTASPTTSTTINQSTNYTTNVGQGGQVNAQASATLDGQAFNASVTFYVLGPSGGIPNSTISARLYGLYSGTTSGLLTGIAMHESHYAQFYNYSEMGFTGLWPQGNRVGTLDLFVGLMQIPNNMPDGFDWLTNTQGGANTFQDKLSAVASWVAGLQKQYPSLPNLSGTQQEDNALVLYGGYDALDYPAKYYIWQPNSSDNGWVEDTSSPAYAYVYAQATTNQQAGVRNEIQAQ